MEVDLGNMKNALIFVIGIDGSGKTRHSLSLSRELSRAGTKCTYVRPRYLLLQLILHSNEEKKTSRKSFLDVRLLTTSYRKKRSQFFRTVSVPFMLIYIFATHWLIIKPLLRESVVVCDRYFFDWFCNLYGGKALVRLLPKPDLGFFLDISVSAAFSRMQQTVDRRNSTEYYESLRQWYLSISEEEGFSVIDSSHDFEKARTSILENVKNFLRAN